MRIILKKISPKYFTAILATFVFSALTFAQSNQNNWFLNSLTQEEREWLNNHKTISVALDPDWPPVEFVNDEGIQAGMSLDYLRIVEQRLNIKFKRVQNLNWAESYAKLKNWEIDVTTSVTETPQRRKFWAFTKPYLDIPIVIATQTDVTYISDIKQLANKKIALVKDFALEEWIKRDYPDFNIVRVRNAIEGLDKVQSGEVYAYLDNFLIIGFYQAKMKAANIKIAGLTPYSNTPSMAVRKDWVIFAGILDKALGSISEKERDLIYHKWLPERYEYDFDYLLLIEVGAGLTIIIIILIFWNRKLVREIRQRKKAESELIISESKYHNLVDNALVGVFIADQTGLLQYVNEAARKIFEYDSLEEMYGKHVSVMLKNPDDRHKAVEILVNKKVLTSYEVEGITKKGRIIIFLLNASYHDGIITGLVLDVTTQKRMVDELIAAKEKAEEMNKVKSVFFANMSHELRTPFVGILGFAEMIEESAEDLDIKKMSKAIIESAKRINRTLNNLLELSQLVTENPEIRYEPILIKEIVEEVYSGFREQAVRKSIDFNYSLNGLDEKIYSDATLLNGILTNLVSNAVNYTFKGKVLIEAAKEKEAGIEYLLLVVTDTGIGIAKENQEVIWDEFRQESEGLSRSFEGTGLGLTLTKRYVNLLDGIIFVESEVNVGSKFTVKIPLRNKNA